MSQAILHCSLKLLQLPCKTTCNASLPQAQQDINLLKDGGRRGIHTWLVLVIAQGKDERARKESSHREVCMPRENLGISIKTGKPRSTILLSSDSRKARGHLHS